MMYSLLAMRVWDWSDLAFLSPVLSVITATKFIGEWQSVCWSVFYSTVSGSVLGVVIGLLWEFVYLQLLFSFVGILIINKCQSWTPLAKVFGSLCYMLGVLLPTLNGGDEPYNSAGMCLQLILFTNIPIWITGVTLLFPVPRHSLVECQQNVCSLCKNLSLTIDSSVNAFLHPTQALLHMSMAEQYISDASSVLEIVKQLQVNLKKESFIFPSLRRMNNILTEVIPIFGDILDTLRDLKAIGYDILPNNTQVMFVKCLQLPLQQLQQLINVTLNELVVDKVKSVSILSCGCRSIGGIDAIISPEKMPSFPHKSLESGLSDNVEKNGEKILCDLRLCSTKLMEASQEARINYVFIPPPPMLYEASPITAQNRLSKRNLKVSMLENDINKHKELLSGPDSMQSSEMAANLFNENVWHGAHNSAPRGAYLCRICRIIDYTDILLTIMLNNELHDGRPEANSGFFKMLGMTTRTYTRQLIRSSKNFLDECLHVLASMAFLIREYVPTTSNSIDDDKNNKQNGVFNHLSTYIHPVKVSSITTLASLLVISPKLRELFPYGLWGFVVVILIRQDSSASSFHKGYQRVEGTLLGCLFAFSLSRMLMCTDNVECSSKSPGVLLPILCIWIAICALFRQDSQHGYAALVAGFTPIVILMGPIREGTRDAAWARVEMTFIGVFLYLLMDNLVLPNRCDNAIRNLALDCVQNVRDTSISISKSMSILVSVGDEEIQESDVDCDDNRVIELNADRISKEEDVSSDLSGDMAPREQYEEEQKYLECDETQKVSRAKTLSLVLAIYHDSLVSINGVLSKLRENNIKMKSLYTLACNEPQLWFRCVCLIKSNYEICFVMNSTLLGPFLFQPTRDCCSALIMFSTLLVR